jgi:hypothetical protein
MMYRCVGCDSPAQFGCGETCPTQQTALLPVVIEPVKKINIASGEDADISMWMEEKGEVCSSC